MSNQAAPRTPPLATILIMEDDDAVRRLLTQRLEKSGYHVFSFPDAAPALDTVDFDAIDLIITDLDMPTRGEAAIQAIRCRGYQIPIIVISGWLNKSICQRLTTAGVNRILPKPFELKELLATIDQLLPAQSQERP